MKKYMKLGILCLALSLSMGCSNSEALGTAENTTASNTIEQSSTQIKPLDINVDGMVLNDDIVRGYDIDYYRDFTNGNRVVSRLDNIVTPLTEGGINRFIIYDSKIIYYKSYNRTLSSYDLMTVSTTELGTVDMSINYFYADNGNLYFLDYDGILSAIELSSGKHIEVANNKYRVSIYGHPVIKGNHIYYTNSEDNFNIYTMDAKTGESKKLVNQPAGGIAIDEDNLYFYRDKVYSVDLDGENKKELYDQPIRHLMVGDEYLFYMVKDDKVIKQHKNSLSTTTLGLKNHASNFSIHKDSLIYTHLTSPQYLYQFNDNGSKTFDVENDDVLILGINNSEVFYELDKKVYSKSSLTGIITDYPIMDMDEIIGFDGEIMYYKTMESKVARYSLKSGDIDRISTTGNRTNFESITDQGLLYTDDVDKMVLKRVNGGRVNDIAKITYSGYKYRDGWVYYTTRDGLYRSKIDGSDTVELLDKRVTSFSIDDIIIYGLDNSIYTMHLDGSNKKQVATGVTNHNFKYADSKLYYLKETKNINSYYKATIHDLICLDLNGGAEPTTLMRDIGFVSGMVLKGDYIYLQRSTDYNDPFNLSVYCGVNLGDNSIKVFDERIGGYLPKFFEDGVTGDKYIKITTSNISVEKAE